MAWSVAAGVFFGVSWYTGSLAPQPSGAFHFVLNFRKGVTLAPPSQSAHAHPTPTIHTSTHVYSHLHTQSHTHVCTHIHTGSHPDPELSL